MTLTPKSFHDIAKDQLDSVVIGSESQKFGGILGLLLGGRIMVTGRVGSGKTWLAQALAGLIETDSKAIVNEGSFRLPPNNVAVVTVEEPIAWDRGPTAAAIDGSVITLFTSRQLRASGQLRNTITTGIVVGDVDPAQLFNELAARQLTMSSVVPVISTDDLLSLRQALDSVSMSDDGTAIADATLRSIYGAANAYKVDVTTLARDLLRAARGCALLDDRDVVDGNDVERVTPLVLAAKFGACQEPLAVGAGLPAWVTPTLELLDSTLTP